VSLFSPLPKSYHDAFNDVNWKNAICDEYNALIKNNTWTLVPRPPDANIVHCMWLFRHKYLADGISVTWDSSGIFLSQKKYAVEILTRDGSLQYLTFTRHDISYTVQQVCLHMHDPREPHFLALKQILRYVCDTLDYGLHLFSSFTTYLVMYSDAYWAGCPTTRRSTFGYYVFLGNNLLSWSSKRQPTLSRSSAEADFRGVVDAVTETCWLRNLLRELHTPLSSATLVYYDNFSVVYLSCNLVQHQRTKHIEIDIHFVRDLVFVGQVRVLHVPFGCQFANIFTKGLPLALFEEFMSSMSVESPPTQTSGECIFRMECSGYLPSHDGLNIFQVMMDIEPTTYQSRCGMVSRAVVLAGGMAPSH
nr:ribonuclease H-like domain-containing protein [Tanacetum cinerariifolium]